MSNLRAHETAASCPESELLAAYVDGKLDARQRALIETHLATCESCYDVFTDVVRITEELKVDEPELVDADAVDWSDVPSRQHKAPPPRAMFWTPARVTFGSLLALAALLMLVVRLDPELLRRLSANRDGMTPELRDLVAAVGSDRPVEPRLTGGFAWGPVRSPTRSATQEPRLSPEIRIAIAQIEKAAADNSSPAQLRASGIASLIEGQWDDAVTFLDRAAQLQPDSARMLSDLSAAYASRGKATGTEADFQKAIATAERAIAIDRGLPEAWFNLGLARDAAGQAEAANDAWRQYLELERDPNWRQEVERRIGGESDR